MLSTAEEIAALKKEAEKKRKARQQRYRRRAQVEALRQESRLEGADGSGGVGEVLRALR